MSQIYKIGYTVNNTLNHLYVFFGVRMERGGVTSEDLVELLTAEPTNPIFEGVFSEQELEQVTAGLPVSFVDELPKTATGKIQRYKLRQTAQAEG